MRTPIAVVVGTAMLLLAAPAVRGGQAPSERQVAAADSPTPAASLITQAFAASHNLNHDEGIALARRAVALEPNAAGTHRALASTLWLKILFHTGAVTVDHYESGMSDARTHLPKPPAELEAEFRLELDRAEALAEARLEREPDSAAAHYDIGAVHGLRASYTASIEGSLRAAFSSARGAYNAHEEVLELEPDHAHSNVVVGTYRYMVSSLGLASRWLAYIAGFGGGKERGISMIETALESGEAWIEGGAALLLIYTREGRHQDAYRLALRMAEHYPGNRLIRLEAGAAAVRAGMGNEAERVLSAGLEALDDETRPLVPGERAVWLFQRGLARLGAGQPDRARADLDAALESGPHGWLRGRVLMGMGKVHDLAGRRDAAKVAYTEGREVCESLDDVICRDEAQALLRRPFTIDGGLE